MAACSAQFAGPPLGGEILKESWLPPSDTFYLAPKVGAPTKINWPEGKQLPPQGPPHDIDQGGVILNPGIPDSLLMSTPVQNQEDVGHAATYSRPLPAAPSQPLGHQAAGSKCLPDAHGLLHCGPRAPTWSTRVDVPENNFGIVINSEIPTPPDKVGQEMFPNDDCIRNRNWVRQGAFIPRVERSEESLCSWLHHHAEYECAFDAKGARLQQMKDDPRQQRCVYDYHSLHKQRSDDTAWKLGQCVAQQLSREVMDVNGIREFFQDAAAVAMERRGPR